MTEYFDWWNGMPTDPQLKDYPIPGAAMVPKLHVAFAESYEPSGPFGAKGLGEIGLDAVPAVIANAVADALGRDNVTLPLTPPRVWACLHEGEGEGEASLAPTGACGHVQASLSRATCRPATSRSISACGVTPPVGLAGEASNAFRERTLSLTCIANLARLPQVTVIGGRVENCPIGLGLVARRGSDRQLLALAEKIVVGRG